MMTGTLEMTKSLMGFLTGMIKKMISLQSAPIEMSEINDSKQMFEKMSLDISAEAKFGLSKGKASLNWEKRDKPLTKIR